MIELGLRFEKDIFEKSENKVRMKFLSVEPKLTFVGRIQKRH